MGATKHHDDMDPVELGRYYGYPDCCILHFLGRMAARQLGHPTMARAPDTAPLIGTGYVPCPVCQNRTESELLAGIAERRKCPKTFPEDEMSGDWVLVQVEDKDAIGA